MKKSFFFLLSSLFIFLFSFPLSALDYDIGLSTNQYLGLGNDNAEKDTQVSYQGDILPHASFLFGDKGQLLVSAGLSFGYEEKASFFVFEVLNTEYSVSLGAFGLKAGRIFYLDPLSFIAEGLFDGVQITHASPLGSFNFGAWYTGLLYKKTANIFMTGNDLNIYAGDNYFASRRLLASFDWAHLSFMEMLRLQAAFAMQFDLNNSNEKIHSQYFTVKAGMSIDSFLFELGGSLETMQLNPKVNGNSFNLAFAWEAGVYWTVPTAFRSRLSFTAHSAGGRVNDTVGAFVPLTAKYYGEIFQPLMSGISALCLDYWVRIMQPFGASVSFSYFVRNDLVTYQDIDLSNNGYFLGGEFFTRVFWSPVSDAQLSLGAGVFVPSMGTAWKSSAKNLWRVDLTAIVALY